MSQAARIQMARLALIDGRLAELAGRFAEFSAEQAKLLADRSRIFDELARGEVDLSTMRKEARPHVPEIPKPSELDRARARKALARNEVRRRLSR